MYLVILGLYLTLFFATGFSKPIPQRSWTNNSNNLTERIIRPPAHSVKVSRTTVLDNPAIAMRADKVPNCLSELGNREPSCHSER